MHATGENMDVVRYKQELYARTGYFTAAIDARYHGQRAAIPYEVGLALNAAAPKVVATATAAAKGRDGTAASLVATVKGLSPKALAALERADAAAGLMAPPVSSAATPPPTEPCNTGILSSPTMNRAGPKMSAPVGSRTAAAEAREEAEARERVLAHERYVQAWLGVMKEFRERRSAEATTAVLATAPPPPPAPAATSSSDGAPATALSAPPAAAPSRWALTHAHRGAAVARSDKVTARNVYELALAAAWRGSGEQPLFLDTVWDLVLLLDVLALRPEVDMTRVGVTGFSMGGTITWLLAVIDPRVAVAAPVSGVQGFGWAIDNKKYHARVGRYPLVFEIAASDLRGTKTAEIDAEVVTGVWNKLLPGVLSVYDAHLSLPTLLPRPLLLATGELDQSCPLPGVQQAADSTRAVYLAWAQEQRRLQLEEEAEAAAQAAAEAVAAEAAEAAAAVLAEQSGSVGRLGSRSLGLESSKGCTPQEGQGRSPDLRDVAAGDVGHGKGHRAEVGDVSRSGTASREGGVPYQTWSSSMNGSAPSRTATADGYGGSAAAAWGAVAAPAVGGSGELEPLLADATEVGMSAATAAATAGMEEEAFVAAAAAARAAALAEAAEHQRREQMAIEGLLGSQFRYVMEKGVEHKETDSMRRAVEQWMHQHLKGPWMRERLAARFTGPE
ncbi:hypothetical protein Vretimale_12441 [Volvox reticuliferus]|uniref:Dienelactone hydrolase domain-containing protein n=1 Tax=Volvox reticuliferus TaxID=1737510 RepID=A0A8J4GIH5_9CHLO|nr:hypothetical protein Vretimale_12441 [Volvox reticuliferus]